MRSQAHAFPSAARDAAFRGQAARQRPAAHPDRRPFSAPTPLALWPGTLSAPDGRGSCVLRSGGCRLLCVAWTQPVRGRDLWRPPRPGAREGEWVAKSGPGRQRWRWQAPATMATPLLLSAPGPGNRRASYAFIVPGIGQDPECSIRPQAVVYDSSVRLRSFLALQATPLLLSYRPRLPLRL